MLDQQPAGKWNITSFWKTSIYAFKLFLSRCQCNIQEVKSLRVFPKGNIMHNLNEGKIMVTAMPTKVNQDMVVAVWKIETSSFAVRHFQPIPLPLHNKTQTGLALKWFQWLSWQKKTLEVKRKSTSPQKAVVIIWNWKCFGFWEKMGLNSLP